MKLATKREIVVRFKQGESCVQIANTIDTREVEQVLREALHGQVPIPRWYRLPIKKKFGKEPR